MVHLQEHDRKPHEPRNGCRLAGNSLHNSPVGTLGSRFWGRTGHPQASVPLLGSSKTVNTATHPQYSPRVRCGFHPLHATLHATLHELMSCPAGFYVRLISAYLPTYKIGSLGADQTYNKFLSMPCYFRSKRDAIATAPTGNCAHDDDRDCSHSASEVDDTSTEPRLKRPNGTGVCTTLSNRNMITEHSSCCQPISQMKMRPFHRRQSIRSFY